MSDCTQLLLDYLPESGERRFAHSRVLIRNHGSKLGESLRRLASTNTEFLQKTRKLVQGALPRLRNLGLETMLKQEVENTTIGVDLRQSLDDLRNTYTDRFSCITELGTCQPSMLDGKLVSYLVDNRRDEH